MPRTIKYTKSIFLVKLTYINNNQHKFIRLGLNVALTHQNRSYMYRDSETKEHEEAQKSKQKEEKTTGRGQLYKHKGLRKKRYLNSQSAKVAIYYYLTQSMFYTI